MVLVSKVSFRITIEDDKMKMGGWFKMEKKVNRKGSSGGGNWQEVFLLWFSTRECW